MVKIKLLCELFKIFFDLKKIFVLKEFLIVISIVEIKEIFFLLFLMFFFDFLFILFFYD